jgi:hypothetical protein
MAASKNNPFRDCLSLFERQQVNFENQAYLAAGQASEFVCCQWRFPGGHPV